MRSAYVDMVGGAAGDMLLAALIDAGAPASELQAAVESLGVGAKLHVSKKMCGFLAAHTVRVEGPDEVPHRHLSDVLQVIGAAGLPEVVAARATRVFEALARAEAAVHGTTPEQVHFHEVGAVDAIVDVVGVVLALHLLGVERLESSPLPVCRGTTRAEHGVIPLPAPAVLELVAEVGAPVEGREGNKELVTPTAAALLTTLAERFGPYPPMEPSAVGYGGGTRAAGAGDPPNVVRVVVGRSPTSSEGQVVVLEANLDDQTPEALAFVAERLREAGALDVFMTPVQMKKGRPGVLLTCLASAALAGPLEDLLLAESSSLGVRRRREDRTVLPREVRQVETPYGPVRVKVAQRPGGSVTGAPEFEDVAARARSSGEPLQRVYDAALAAFAAGS